MILSGPELLKYNHFGHTRKFTDDDMITVRVELTQDFFFSHDYMKALLEKYFNALNELGVSRNDYFFTSDDDYLTAHFYDHNHAVLFKLVK